MSKTVTLNDLPRFSPWPYRLLGLQSCAQKQKNTSELLREFEQEKWGKLLGMAEKHSDPLTLSQVLEWEWGEQPRETLISLEESFEVLSPKEGRQLLVDWVQASLRPYLPSLHLVELGAGFGNILIELGKSEAYHQTHFYAGELTQSGQTLIQRLSHTHQVACTVGNCDFNRAPMTSLKLPQGVIIYTVMAAICIPELQNHFIEELLQYDPQVVFHWEPCYEALKTETLLDALRKRYFEVNDYNRNIRSLIQRYVDRGVIEWVTYQPNKLGLNPLLPFTLFGWRPTP